jgi:hypothetical protein
LCRIVYLLPYKYNYLNRVKTKKNSHSFKVKTLYINNFIYNRLENFGLALDITFGYSTYDKLRNLFSKLVTNESYVIPNEREALLEYKRILSDGMASLVGNMNKSIISNPDKILKKFPEIEDKNNCSVFPIFISLYNHIHKS